MADLRLQTTGGGIHDKDATSLQSLRSDIEGMGVAWLDILKPDDEVRAFLLEMGFSEQAVEDTEGHTSNTVQKAEGHRFIVVRARDADSRLDTEPIIILIKGQLIITVRHTKLPALRFFKRRFKRADPEDIKLGVDYFFYELLDSIADDWQPILGGYSDDLDKLEDRVFDPAKRYDNLLEGLHELKQHLREASKSIESLHSATLSLLKPGERLISESTIPHFTDLQHLVTTQMKRCHNYSTGATSTRDTYLANSSWRLMQSNQRLTEVMTMLTIIGAIILPLTLVVGFFGMNVEEFGAGNGSWSLKTIGLVMFGFSGVMLTLFWRRGWFSRYDD